MEKYPLGIQNFEKLRTEGWIYVDKTAYIYSLLQGGSYYFLSRPRRFGKSLFLSTLKAFFEGKRHLFQGLYIDRCEDVEWEEHPVIHIDLTGQDYSKGEESLFLRIDSQLNFYEKRYNIAARSSDLAIRFLELIRTAHEESGGKKIAVLIDEYDKPVLDTLHIHDLKDKHGATLSGFYSVLKAADEYLCFCFITGITKFRNLNIFSGLNNLQIISVDKPYDAICGITETELQNNFPEGIANLANKEKITIDETINLLKTNYDGYHFAPDSRDIYNPFSVLNALAKMEIQPFWFYSGTPTFLVRFLQKQRVNLRHIEGAVIDQLTLVGANATSDDAVSLLYQAGYLTIKNFDNTTKTYTLGYPNLEVEESFMKVLLPAYSNLSDSESKKRDMLTVLKAPVRKSSV